MMLQIVLLLSLSLSSLSLAIGEPPSLPPTQTLIRSANKVEFSLKMNPKKKLSGYTARIYLDKSVPNTDAIISFELNGKSQTIFREATRKIEEPVKVLELDWHPNLRGFTPEDLQNKNLKLKYELFFYKAQVEKVTAIVGEKSENTKFTLHFDKSFPSAPEFFVSLSCNGKNVSVRALNVDGPWHYGDRGAPSHLLSISMKDATSVECKDKDLENLKGTDVVFGISGSNFLLKNWFTVN